MTLSTIRKKYPNAWNEFMKKNSGCSIHEDYLHVIEIRHWFTSFVDHFDKLGLMLSIIYIDADLSDLGKEYEGQWAYQITNPEKRLLCYRNTTKREKADRKGLILCFEEREKQLKNIQESGIKIHS